MSLGKEIKCEACQVFYCFFHNKFNTFNNTQGQMSDSVYQITLKLLLNHIFNAKMLRFGIIF